VWKYATVFFICLLFGVQDHCDAKRSELLAQNLQQDLKDETAAFVHRQQDLSSLLADGTG